MNTNKELTPHSMLEGPIGMHVPSADTQHRCGVMADSLIGVNLKLVAYFIVSTLSGL